MRQWLGTAEPLAQSRYDNWNTHIQCTHKNVKLISALICSDPIDHTPEQALTFIQECISANSDRPLRGPFLAHLELIKQLQGSAETPERSYGRSKSHFRAPNKREYCR